MARNRRKIYTTGTLGSKKILPENFDPAHGGAPAAGAGRGKAFDESTNQQAIMRLVFSRIGDLARQHPGGVDNYPAQKHHFGNRVPPGSQVTASKDRKDAANFGASGGRTGKSTHVRAEEQPGLGPSVVLVDHGVYAAKVPAALAGRRRRAQRAL